MADVTHAEVEQAAKYVTTVLRGLDAAGRMDPSAVLLACAYLLVSTAAATLDHYGVDSAVHPAELAIAVVSEVTRQPLNTRLAAACREAVAK